MPARAPAALAILAALAATVAFPLASPPAAASPQPPPQTWPVPPDPPPIVRARGADGRRIREQVWVVGPEMVRIRPLSIAQQRWIADRLAATGLEEQRSVSIRCLIAPDGTVGFLCDPVGLAPSSPLYTVARRKGISQQPYFGQFPAVAPDSRIVRRVEYRIGLDPDDRPPPPPADDRRFDPAAASAIVALLQRRLRDSFPSSALAVDMDALVVGDCRVEADRSLSCRTLSVAPEAARRHFAGVIEGIYPVGTVPETLTDGTPTPGLVFRVPVRFMIAR